MREAYTMKLEEKIEKLEKSLNILHKKVDILLEKMTETPSTILQQNVPIKNSTFKKEVGELPYRAVDLSAEQEVNDIFSWFHHGPNFAFYANKTKENKSNRDQALQSTYDNLNMESERAKWQEFSFKRKIYEIDKHFTNYSETQIERIISEQKKLRTTN